MLAFRPDMFCYYFLCCSILSSLGHGTGRATLFITFYGTFMTVAQDALKCFFLQQPKSPKEQTTRFYFQLWKLCITSFQPNFFFSHKNKPNVQIVPLQNIFYMREKTCATDHDLCNLML